MCGYGYIDYAGKSDGRKALLTADWFSNLIRLFSDMDQAAFSHPYRVLVEFIDLLTSFVKIDRLEFKVSRDTDFSGLSQQVTVCRQMSMIHLLIYKSLGSELC